MRITHIEHVEDLLLQGDLGIAMADRQIKEVLRWLTSADPDYKDHFTPISIKIDGSPTIVFGVHNDRFFVSTKRAFNKEPVRFFSKSQIESAYPDDEELQKKLCQAWQYLQNVHPKDGFVYQGDLLFYDGRFNRYNTLSSFKPNFVEYVGTGTCHPFGCRLGISVHTRYEWRKTAYQRDMNYWEWKFTDTNNVFVHNPALVRRTSFNHYSAPVWLDTKVKGCLEDAVQIFDEVDRHALAHYVPSLKKFINYSYISNVPRNTHEWCRWASGGLDDGDWADKFFEAHKWLTLAKLFLIQSLDDCAARFNGQLTPMINGEPRGHEGFVYHADSVPTKFVNRSVMSVGIQNLIAQKKGKALSA